MRLAALGLDASVLTLETGFNGRAHLRVRGLDDGAESLDAVTEAVSRTMTPNSSTR